MPIARFEMPDGRIGRFEVPDGTSPEEAQQLISRSLGNIPAAEEVPKKKGLGAALAKGTESLFGSAQTAFETPFGANEAATRGLKRSEALGGKYEDQVSLDKLKQAYEQKGIIGAGGELLRQAPLALAEQAPNLAASFTGARLGAMAGAPFGPYGAGIGALGGALLPSATQLFGSNVERQAATQKEAGQPTDINVGSALGATAVQAPLDVVATYIPLGGKLVGKILGPEIEKLLMRGGTQAAEKLAQEGFAKTLGKGLVTGAAAEIPTEVLQQVAERAQAGLSLTSPDALKEYVDTAYQVGLLAPIGGAGRFVDKSAARGEIATTKKAEEDKVIAEQQATQAAQAEMATIAAEQKPIPVPPEQIAQMQQEVVSQRGTLQRELDRLRSEAVKESDIDKLAELSTRAAQLQTGLNELDPDKVKNEINKLGKEAGALVKQIKDAEKKGLDTVEPLSQELEQKNTRLEQLKTKLPALAPVVQEGAGADYKALMATKLKQIDVAKEKGDFEALSKLVAQYKEMQGKYQGIQGSLFEGQNQYTYPEAEVRETALAKEIETSRPDMALPKKISPEEKQYQDAIDALRSELPEPEKKEVQKIQMLPIGELRGHLNKLETDRREILKVNPELTKGIDDQVLLTAKEQGKKVAPEFTVAAKKLAVIEDSILSTQRRIDEEELGNKLPKDKIPASLYALPAGYPSAKYNQFAERIGKNAESAFDELTQTLFNTSKGITDDIANTPELLSKKIEGLRSIVIKNSLREVEAKRRAAKLESLSTDGALKVAARIDANLRELINRLPALPKKQILDQLGLSEEPRLELMGRPSQIKFKKQQQELNEVRANLIKVEKTLTALNEKPEIKVVREKLSSAVNEKQIDALSKQLDSLLGYPKQEQRKLEKRQEYLEEQLRGAVTGSTLQPVVVSKLGKTTIDPRELGARPLANLNRALQIFKEDIAEAKQEAATGRGKLQKEIPVLKVQERDPVAGLNALLPKTRVVEKLKSALYQAQNATKPNEKEIDALKKQIINASSDQRKASLFLEQIDKLRIQDKEIETNKTKQEEIDMERVAPSGVNLDQGSLFGEKELEPVATIRATPENFMRFLSSAAVFKMREKLGLLEKKNVELSTKMSKAPTLTALNEQRKLVSDLNRFDQTVGNFRLYAAELWQNRKKIAKALDNALYELANGTTPKIEELKKERKKYSFKQYAPEYKELTDQITAKQKLLYDQNFKAVGEYGIALREFDQTVDERNATLEAIQARIQDLTVRNVKDERKTLARMERQFANQSSPASRKNKEYADKARSIIAQIETTIEESSKKRIATKRIEEEQRAVALKELPVIRRITEQTRAFTKADNSKELRSEIRALEKKLEDAKPGTPQYAKLTVQIGGLKADLDRAIQPLMRKVVEAEITPTPIVKRESKKKGVRFAKGQTTGYDYLTKNPENINDLIDQALTESLSAETKKRLAVAPTPVKEEQAGKVKVAEVKAKEGELRDALEAAKTKLVTHNRQIAATKKALSIAKTPSKITELKRKLAGLNQSSTKQELGKKIDALTKEYREVRALGTGVERMMAMAEEESLKSSRLHPLKTGVKKETTAKESITKEATRREYAENEAAEAGIRNVDYLSVLDGLEGGFKARDEKTQGTGVSQVDVKKELAKIKMPKGLDIIVLDKLTPHLAEYIQQRGYDPKTIRGAVMANGKVLIVAGNHTNIKDVKATIAHELIGHVGVDGLLGEAGMKALAKRIQKDENSVFELAKKLGVFDDVLGAYSAARRYMSEEDAVTQAVRELIAHVEEASPNRSFLEKANAFIKAMVGALRAVLRKMGLDLDISTSDIYKLLRDARANFKDMAPGAHISKDGNIVFRNVPAVANTGFAGVLADSDNVVFNQKSFVDQIRGAASGLLFKTKYIDRFAPVQAVVNQMKDSLKATQLMYYLRMHDQRMSWTSEIASHGALDLVPAKDGKGLMIESISGANLKDMAAALKGANVGNTTATTRVFTMYLAAIRAKRVGLNKLNFGGKVTQQMLDDAMAAVNRDPATKDAFEKAAKIYAKYNEGLINFAVKTGAMNKDVAKELLKDGDYVPFYRTRTDGSVWLEIGGAPAIKIGNLADQPYLHELVGGDQPILDVFTSALQNTTMLTDMALRNLATRNTANTLNEMGLLRGGKDKGIHPGGKDVKGPTIIRFKADGKDYWADVNSDAAGVPAELLVKGLEGVNTSLPNAVKMMNVPANLLRKWVTRNPAYALRQVIRDPLNAVFTTGLDTTPIISSVKEIVNMWRGKSDGEMVLQHRGILGGQVLTGTDEDKKKIMNDILSGKKGWDYRMAQLDQLAIQGDASTRVVMYNNFIKQGLSEMEATLATLESMNFSKRGISPSLFALSTMVPFMNAQIQGLNVLYQAFTGKMPFSEKLKVKQKLMQRAIMMAGFTMIYASMMQDDEGYQNANDDEKYGNWFFPNPFGEEHIKVPIPYEVGLLFKAIPEALVNTMFGDDKARDTMSAIGKMAWNSIPISGPQGIKPLLEVAINHSFFTGRAIDSDRMMQYEPGERYGERTTELAKIVGGALNISPNRIEYLIRGYTGSLPIALASVANPVIRGGEVGEQPESRGMLSSETPLIGSFFQAKDAGGLINKAYKDMNEIVQTKQTYEKMVEEGREKEADDYLTANADMIAMGTFAGAFRKKMGDLTKAERNIRADSSMTGAEKRAELDAIRQDKIALAKEFSSARE